MGSYALFAHLNWSTNVELWRTDGTAGGTFQLKEIKPGHMPSFPSKFVRGGSIAFFVGYQSTSAPVLDDLWRSDGTEAGTFKLVDTNPGVSDDLTLYRAAGSRLFFSAADPVHGTELWTSDGTTAGTYMVKDIDPSTRILAINRTGTDGTRFYFATANAVYVSDGTAAGTQLLVSGPNVNSDIVASGGFMYFTDSSGKLWRSDGTAGGTVNVATGTAYSSVSLVDVNGILFYCADQTNALLWRYTGSGSITRINVSTTVLLTNAAKLTPVNGTLYLSASTSASGTEVFRVIGTGNAALVGEIAGGSAGSSPTELTDVAGTLFFRAGTIAGASELYKVTGPAAGISMVLNLQPGGSTYVPQGFTAFGTTLLFDNRSPVYGWELWRSDGTSGGTAMIVNANPSTYSAGPTEYFRFGDKVLFRADDGVHGDELWVTDGTLLNTYMLADLNPSGDSRPEWFMQFGDNVYFAATTPGEGQELWATNGTSGGTYRVKDVRPGSAGSSPYPLLVLNGLLYFSARDEQLGYELWRTDGTEAGTILVKDIYSGAGDGMGAGAVVLNGRLIFGANDGVHGVELWQSDGTAAGTTLLKDIKPGGMFDHGDPQALMTVGNLVYFWANHPTLGRELWRTDGTAAGTMLVADINPGSGDSYSGFSSEGPPMVDYHSEIYFLAKRPDVGIEPFRSDGTAAGTRLVKDLLAGPADSIPYHFTVLGERLYFTSTEGKLWRSDGTDAGTENIMPAGLVTSATWLREVNGRLFFNARVVSTGYYEVFTSDGTATGTYQLSSIAPGIGNGTDSAGAAGWVTPAGNQGDLVITVDDGISRNELWVVDDDWGPYINGDNLQVSPSQTLRLSTNESLGNLPGVAHLTLRNLETSAFLNPDNIDLAYDPIGKVLSFTFTRMPGGRLADGAYRLTIANAGIRDLAGNPMSANWTEDFAIVSAGAQLTLPPGVLKLNHLSVAAGGRLDLQNRSLALDYRFATPLGSWNGSAYDGVLGLVSSGRNGGAWNGSGIVSSTAAGSGDYHTLGIGEASEILGLTGSQTALWNGQTIDASTVLIKYTYGGDVNLDGHVDVDDYGQLDFNASTGGALKGYFNGDLDLNGIFDVDDYGIIDFVVGIQGPPL